MSNEQWIAIGLALAAALIAIALVLTTIAWRGGRRLPPVPSGLAPTQAWRLLKRVVIAIVGMSVLIFGLALLVLPGPAVLVIPAGLAILATEFAWARRLLNRARQTLRLKHNHAAPPAEKGEPTRDKHSA
ncbi:MAG: PGPGW domain-containing protein [Phycisphaeraceae bacterium]